MYTVKLALNKRMRLTINKNIFLLGDYNHEIITLKTISIQISISIPQNIAIYSFKYFVSHIMVISRKCTVLYSSTNIFLCCIILRNTIIAPK